MKRRGFTLLEILIATALAGMVLLAMNTLIFSMAELWGNTHSTRTFDLHVRALSSFLDRELRTAALANPVTAGTAGSGGGAGNTGTATGTAAATGATGFSWQVLSSSSASARTSNAPVLVFMLPAGSRLMPWPARSLPDVTCALQVRDGVGLVLLWHSQYETNFTSDPPRETLLSPFVTKLEYDFYTTDTKQWVTTPDPQTQAGNNGQYPLPNRLRLTFAFEDRTEEVAIMLPVPTQGLPTY